MAKRKRAPGGGRKPKGDFSELTTPLTIRMPGEMRKELEAAAKKGCKSVTQELLRRLQNSFNRDRKKSRDPALQAICYLIAELAEGVTNPAPMHVANMRPLWRSDPFLFRAFKLAVGKLLDALEPAGEIKSPVILEITDKVAVHLTTPKFIRDAYRTPEALADFCAAGILQALIRSEPLNKFDPRITKWDENDGYGMEFARRDLSVKPQGGKS
jgi:Arc-like DNA binding domain